MKLRESVMLFAGVSCGATCSLFHMWARFYSLEEYSLNAR